MINKWKIIFYESDDGQSEVENFINSRSQSNRAKIYALLSFLEEKGPTLPRPYADFLQDGIHELRLKLSGNQVRILYFFCYKDFIILTNSFIKNTNKVPISEIKKAKKYKEIFLKRFNEKKLNEKYNENI